MKNKEIFNKLNELSDKYFGDTITEYLTMQEYLNSYNNADELFDDLRDNGYFNEEIIYYSNSEILASLHASKKKEETYFECIAEQINELLES